MKILVLTDHGGHTVNNSVYAIVRAMVADSRVDELRVASRGTAANASFFACLEARQLYATRAGSDFAFAQNDHSFSEAQLLATPLDWADVVWLRIPHPVPANWFAFVRAAFGRITIVNRPEGIQLTTNKAWLLNVPELCAEMALCESPQELAAFAKTQGDIVIKPLEGYGGQGILRANAAGVDVDDKRINFLEWPSHPLSRIPYMAVEFLPRVSEGDKRIVVVNGEVFGAVLRVPKAGHWLANVSQGGHAELAEISFAERRIISTLLPKMQSLGIVMYGIDTLMGNQGERVLSEINTMSIGGINDLPAVDGRTAPQRTASALLDYFQAN